MVRPAPSSVPVTLGYRQKMKSRPTYIHRGIDYGAPVGTKVIATKSGTVVHAGRGGMGTAFGIHVVLKTSGIFHIYAHLSSESVSVGQTIATGQQVGKSGATGNVTGPHLHYGEFTSYSYLKDRTPQFVDYKPTPPVVKPNSKGPWFTVATYNLKAPSLTPSGKHKWSLRRARQIANIKAALPDVLCLQEVGSPTDAKWYDAQLGPLGYQRVAGSKWRYIYVRTATTKFLVGGTIELSPLLDKNTKQMAWAALEVNGSYALVGNWHLEARDGSAADAIRVKQAAFGVTALTRTAASVQKSLGVTIPRDRWVIAGDTNSQSLVAEAMVKLGFVSALTNALKSVYGAIASFNNWLAARNGKSIDYIFVDKTRPVETWSQKSDSVASDHNLIAARLGRKG